MPPLRSHKKSRTGCLQCKARRVKCDEKGNPCGNCAFGKAECTYPVDSSAGIVSTPILPSPAVEPSQPEASASPFQGSRSDENASTAENALPAVDASNKLLMELMHKFSSDTYKSFCADPEDADQWQFSIPRRALHHDFLMNGILSVAALHLAVTESSTPAMATKCQYIDAAMEYQARALQPYQEALRNISPENCDAIFSHSALTIVYSIAFPQLAVTRNGAREDFSMIDSVFMLFGLVQRTAEINRISRDWLQEPTNLPRGHAFWAPSKQTPLEEDTDQALKRLDELNDRENDDNQDKHRMISEATEMLRGCFRRHFALGDLSSVLTWPAISSREFVECLKQHERLSLTILMHWGVLLARLDGKFWWASGAGAALVSDTMRILQRDGSELGVASWPKEKLGL